jgi:hypothetical protein
MITKLTPDQEAQIPVYVERGLKMGLRTKPIDPAEAQEAFNDFYEKILGRSKVPVEIVGGPTEAWKTIKQRMGKSGNKSDSLSWPFFDGQFWAAWFAYYDYIREVLKIKFDSEKYLVLRRCAIGVPWPMEDVCILADCPIRISMVNGVLHNETQAAIEYRDGTKIFSLNGVKMKPCHVLTPASQLDPKEILAEKNVDVRRELIRKKGIESMLENLPHKSLEKKGTYELLSVMLSDEVVDARYLKMVNPSIKVFHMEGVAPECASVQQALNWRAGNINEDWKPAILT